MTARRAKKHPANANAMDILGAWTENDPALRQMIAEERSHAAVARQIYDLRMARGLTQRQLADLVGTKQPVIARLEDADYEGHSLSMLSRIADALGYSVAVSFLPRSANGAAPRRKTSVQRKPRRATPKTRAT